MASPLNRALLLLVFPALLAASAVALAAADEADGLNHARPARGASRAPESAEPERCCDKPCCARCGGSKSEPEPSAPADPERPSGCPRSAGETAGETAGEKTNEAATELNRPKSGSALPVPERAARKVGQSGTNRKSSSKELLSGFDPLDHERVNGNLVHHLEQHGTAVLSLDPGLQEHVAKILARYRIPFGAVVALEPSTGRVLAYVSHSSADPEAGDLARDPSPPSASVFKVITTAALLDAGVGPNRRVCYGGGRRKLVEADLIDDPDRDRHCLTLQDALGYSANAVFAKLADRHLDRPTLERYASAFGFGHSLPFDARTPASPMEVPEERVEFARTAAGFWHMYMSPLHGALIAATIANRGVMPRASMIDRVVDGSGRQLSVRQPTAFRPVIPSSTARVLGKMMTRTVTHGTSRRAFFDQQGRAFLPGVKVAGKTGSLTQPRPFRDYSWWIGFAPLEKPTIALAALVVNSPRWRIKASYLARETLRHYLVVN